RLDEHIAEHGKHNAYQQRGPTASQPHFRERDHQRLHQNHKGHEQADGTGDHLDCAVLHLVELFRHLGAQKTELRPHQCRCLVGKIGHKPHHATAVFIPVHGLLQSLRCASESPLVSLSPEAAEIWSEVTAEEAPVVDAPLLADVPVDEPMPEATGSVLCPCDDADPEPDPILAPKSAPPYELLP